MANTENPNVIMLQKVRISYPHLETPQTPRNVEKAEPTYNAEFILDPVAHSAVWNEFKLKLESAATEKWGDMAPAVLQQIITGGDKNKCDFGDGNTKIKADMTIAEGYKDMTFIKARSRKPIDIYNEQGQLIDLRNPMDKSKRPYGGCYVNALVSFWLQDNQFGRAIRFELLGVQFVKDGPPFGRTEVATKDYFKKIEGAPEPVTPAGGMPWNS